MLHTDWKEVLEDTEHVYFLSMYISLRVIILHAGSDIPRLTAQRIKTADYVIAPSKHSRISQIN